MREQDSNLCSSAYETDELPLLHPALMFAPYDDFCIVKRLSNSEVFRKRLSISLITNKYYLLDSYPIKG